MLRRYDPSKVSADEASRLAQTKGGRLWLFMAYDTVLLATCIGVGVWTWYAVDEPEYKIRARVFHVKMLYSMCTFPWLLLSLPLAFTLVLHLKPTAYNQAGQVVRVASAKQRKAARDRRLAQRRRKAKVTPSTTFDPS